MDIEDFTMRTLGITLATLLIVVIMSVVFLFIQVAFFTPHQAEDARQQCLSMGSTTYVDFDGTLFSTKAIGVRCEFPETTSNINLNNQNPLISISGST